jgi:hypothetical protein
MRQVFPALGPPFVLHDCVYMPVFLLLRRHLLTSSSSTRQAYHHYLKVVTTNIEGLVMGRRQLKAYQIIQSSQLAYYRNDVVPEAKVNALAGISLTGEIIMESQPPASCRGNNSSFLTSLRLQ